MFSQSPLSLGAIIATAQALAIRGGDRAAAYVPPLALLQPAVYLTGRNDPCPCKSGKKYKKCCRPGTPIKAEKPCPPPS